MTYRVIYERDYINAFYLAPVFAMVLIFYSVMHSAVGGSVISYDIDQNLVYMDEFKEAKKQADISIVMLGNSRLRNSVEFGFDPKKLVDLPDGRKLAAIQYTENAAKYLSFEYLEGHILSAKPDYLLYVNSILTNVIAQHNIMVHYARLVMGYLTYNIVDKDEFDHWWEQRTLLAEPCYDEFTHRMMNLRIETTKGRDLHDLDPETNENIAKMRDFIKRATEAGIKVIIIDIPPNMEALNKFNVEPYILDFYGLEHSPTPEELFPDIHDRLIWVNYKHPYGSDHFCDFVHFNDLGRPIFNQWFINLLSSM